jgi:hypothetical protein
MKKVLFVLISLTILSCSKNYDLSAADKIYLNKVIDSMYEIDQGKRHYFHKIDSLYNFKMPNIKTKTALKQALGDNYESYRKTVRDHWDDVNKCDSLNTLELIKITKKYGFPSNTRLGVYKSKAHMIFVHSPRESFEEIRSLINKEFIEGRISEYAKEYIFWHLNGRTGKIPRYGEGGKAVWM